MFLARTCERYAPPCDPTLLTGRGGHLGALPDGKVKRSAVGPLNEFYLAWRSALLLAVPGLVQGLPQHRCAGIRGILKKVLGIFVKGSPGQAAQWTKQFAHACRLRAVGGSPRMERRFRRFFRGVLLDVGRDRERLLQLARVGRALPAPGRRVLMQSLRQHRQDLTSEGPPAFDFPVLPGLSSVEGFTPGLPQIPVLSSASFTKSRREGGLAAEVRDRVSFRPFRWDPARVSTRVSLVLRSLLREVPPERMCRAEAIAERGWKGRTVTAMPVADVTFGHVFRDTFWPLLDVPEVDLGHFTCSGWSVGPGEVVLSADLSRATDLAPHWLGRSVVEELVGILPDSFFRVVEEPTPVVDRNEGLRTVMTRRFGRTWTVMGRSVWRLRSGLYTSIYDCDDGTTLSIPLPSQMEAYAAALARAGPPREPRLIRDGSVPFTRAEFLERALTMVGPYAVVYPRGTVTQSQSVVTSRRGWLMGMPASWLILTLVHLATARRAGFRRFVVRGDDLLAVCRRSQIDSYFAELERLGFLVNRSKSFISRSAGIFAEASFLRNRRFELVPGRDVSVKALASPHLLAPHDVGPALSSVVESYARVAVGRYSSTRWRVASRVGLSHLGHLPQTLRRHGIPIFTPRPLGGCGIPKPSGFGSAVASSGARGAHVIGTGRSLEPLWVSNAELEAWELAPRRPGADFRRARSKSAFVAVDPVPYCSGRAAVAVTASLLLGRPVAEVVLPPLRVVANRIRSAGKLSLPHRLGACWTPDRLRLKLKLARPYLYVPHRRTSPALL